MSIKIKVSYVTEEEKKEVLRLLSPLVGKGYKYKVVQGKPYNRLYLEENVKKC